MTFFLQRIRIVLISQPFAMGMVRYAIVKRTVEQDFFYKWSESSGWADLLQRGRPSPPFIGGLGLNHVATQVQFFLQVIQITLRNRLFVKRTVQYDFLLQSNWILLQRGHSCDCETIFCTWSCSYGHSWTKSLSFFIITALAKYLWQV